MADTDLLIPQGARLLHIGPSKTGTTAIQSALARSRSAMAAHGVVYPGKDRQHWRAAVVAIGAPGRRGDPPLDPTGWEKLLVEVDRAGERRVVLSAEMFAQADAAAARRVVADLGGPRVHVVVTLRPLVKILPSAWQQTMHQGWHASYEEWLVAVLGKPPFEGSPAPPRHPFWRRHRHGALVARWARAVGSGNLTVVVLDESDRGLLLRSFEQLLGLPAGLLVAPKVTNPSLNFGEVELVRQVNREFQRRGWPDSQHRALVRKGLAHHLQNSPRRTPDGQRIATPAWAVERAGQIGAAAAARIAATGVRVVGDLASLGSAPQGQEAEQAPSAVVTAQSASLAVIGTILAAQRGKTPRRKSKRPDRSA